LTKKVDFEQTRSRTSLDERRTTEVRKKRG